MDKLKKEILKITSDTRVLTQKELFHLLLKNKVKLNMTNYQTIILFLKENKIKLIDKEDKNQYVLRK